MNDIVLEGEVKQEITKILERKISGEELDLEPRIDVINSFIEKEIQHMTNYVKTLDKKVEDPTKILYPLFRDALEEVGRCLLFLKKG
ncbi:putative nucleotidyltransferase [Cytobacillus purgationiresistens]|uniref:Nucleotidyltransferase n=1 Tax=Cytobacillus purgationiresistens TaxID=863449 RepID=A0ABU0AQI5_9BACI|nr:nucleotidyltransferase domain-containing protein [Cytobacillus purgationiresistens]MDQ0273285.1 putative nucleotidyltransferase [Cytobacillus purgationiresistens]